MTLGLVNRGANLRFPARCRWKERNISPNPVSKIPPLTMISEMPGPICVRLSGIVGGRWVIVLGQKNQKVEHGSCVLATQPYLVSARVTTLSALRTVAL